MNSSQPIVFIAHRDELLKQTADKMQLVWEGVSVGRVKGAHNEQDVDLIVASTQTLVRGREIVQPGLVIYDEAHHSASKGSKQVLENLGCFRLDGPPLLGITATPNRADKLALGDIFEEIVYEKKMLDLIIAGYLCDIRAKRIVVESLDLNNLKTIAGDFDQNDLGEAMTQDDVIDCVIDAYIEYGEERKTIVFAANVHHTYAIAERFNERGIAAKGIDGSLPGADRELLLKSFAANDFNILVNCMVLTEGFDEPSVSCVIMARPTKSESLYVQCIGRGIRLHPDKVDCLVLDIVGVTENHSLMTLSKLFSSNEPEVDELDGEPLELRDNESVMELQERVHSSKKEYQQHMFEVNLFTKQSIYRWIKITDRAYYISMGDKRACYILLDDEFTRSWWALFENTDKRIFPLYHEPIVIEYAQGIAENFLKSVENPLMTKEARWRKYPLSQGQKEQLTRYEIAYDHSWTKGEAADALDMLFGKRDAHNVISRFDPEFYRNMMSNPHIREKVTTQLILIQKNIKR
ncbi:hypothetical protein ASF12_22685 [Paenibacillus sp. Leaf72]|nr:hypothetical protein ASF12_22685 [Paenibacillus sp. Leaf72]